MRYTITFCLASLIASPAIAEVPKVVTDIIPVQALVATVMGDLGTPALLLPKGADEHDFQLRPSQAQQLADADLLVWVGPDLTPWLERAQSSIGAGGAQLTLLDAPGTDLHPYEEAENDDQADGHDHDHDHEHGTTDPHAWLSPTNATLWLGHIADRLGALDPENAAIYAANASQGQTDIAAMDARIATLLAPIKAKPFVVFHDAYGYFTRHYGLTIAGSIRQGDATTPGAARITALRDLAEENTAICLFPEVNHDPAQALQLASGTNLRLGRPLDPAGTMLDSDSNAYVTLMETMAQSLLDCLAAP